MQCLISNLDFAWNLNFNTNKVEMQPPLTMARAMP